MKWLSTSVSSGILSILYPRAMKQHLVEHSWRGTYRFISELSGQPIKIEPAQWPDDVNYIQKVSW